MRRVGLFRKTAKRLLDDAIHAGRSLAGRHDGALLAYERLLGHVQSVTTLLRTSERPRDCHTALNAGLHALALHHADWLRPVETWFPTTEKVWPQFTALAHHFFARFPVPPFMTSVWFDLPPGEVLPQHGWYKHLGLGQSIRTAGLPLRFTRAMAHVFVQAPHHYTATAALRWAQVHGLGGGEALARAVVGTRLGRVLENEDFWESVLYFFINHPSLDLVQVGPIVDFLQHQRFEWREAVSPEGVFGKQPPPHPDFSMKGRTVARAPEGSGRLVKEWHQQLGQDTHQPSLSWRHSPFKDFLLVEGSEDEGNMRVWTITELLTSQSLVIEGRALRHCVAIYGGRCARRQTAIWSMQVENKTGRRRLLTIEVDLPKRMIWQARGKSNRMPQPAEREVMDRWAAQQGLRIAEWVRL
jgi:PcfJ-like protein